MYFLCFWICGENSTLNNCIYTFNTDKAIGKGNVNAGKLFRVKVGETVFTVAAFYFNIIAQSKT